MIPPIALAKLRSSKRRREDGAAMFIVAMTLAVLASVGLYALAAASTEIRTSGNERQSTQTHYLAEYGILSASHELTGQKLDFYKGPMIANPDSPCASLPGLPSTADTMLRACRRIESPELSAAWLTPGTPTVKYQGLTPYAATAPGSLGPTPMNADFFIELTAPTQRTAPPKYALDLHFCFLEVTVTSFGVTQPLYPAQPNDPTGSFVGEGLEMQRARFVAGPIADCR